MRSDLGKTLSGEWAARLPHWNGWGRSSWPRSVRQGSGIAMSCAVGPRPGSDPGVRWVGGGPAAAALFGPLAWESPYAKGGALKKKKKKKKRKRHEKGGAVTIHCDLVFSLQSYW